MIVRIMRRMGQFTKTLYVVVEKLYESRFIARYSIGRRRGWQFLDLQILELLFIFQSVVFLRPLRLLLRCVYLHDRILNMQGMDLGSLDVYGWLLFLLSSHLLLSLSFLFLLFLDLAGYVVEIAFVHMREEI